MHSTQHLPALDGLRGVAVLIVLVMHFTILEPASAADRLFVLGTSAGWAGVDLFFVISGFLITGILYDTRDRPNYFRNFYVRRALRIFPLYYAYLALILVLVPLVVTSHAAHYAASDNRVWLWTYLSNVLMAREGWEGMPPHTTHLWSLAVEEQFYLMWPLVVWVVPRRWLLGTCLATVVLGTLARITFHSISPDGIAGYTMTLSRLDALGVGGLIAVALRQPNWAAWPHRLARPAVVVAVVALVWCATTSGVFLGALNYRVQLFAFPAFAVLFGGAVLGAATAPAGSVAYQALTTRFLTSFGRYSYGLYLLHLPLRNFTRTKLENGAALPVVLGSRLPAALLVIVAAIALSYGIAFLSWHAFEARILRLKQHFGPSAPDDRTVSPGASDGLLAPASTRPGAPDTSRAGV